MQYERTGTWWKVAVAIIGPPALAIALGISITGFAVVFNFLWERLGISQQFGYVYTLAIITLFLAILYLTRRRSPNARIWLALPLFTAVLMAVLAVPALGLSGIVFVRLIAAALVLGLWGYTSWIIWSLLADA